MRRLLLLGLLGLAACSPRSAAPPDAASAQPSSEATDAARLAHRLDCTHPVYLDTSSAQVLRDYGDAAIEGQVDGLVEGKVTGVVLNPDSPKDQLDLLWWDDARTKMATARARSHGTGWIGPGGIHVGSTLAEVEAANGKPVLLNDLGRKDGPYAGLADGKLAHLLDGCDLGLRFGQSAGPGAGDISVSGGGGADAQRPNGIVVTEMVIGWPPRLNPPKPIILHSAPLPVTGESR